MGSSSATFTPEKICAPIKYDRDAIRAATWSPPSKLHPRTSPMARIPSQASQCRESLDGTCRVNCAIHQAATQGKTTAESSISPFCIQSGCTCDKAANATMATTTRIQPRPCSLDQRHTSQTPSRTGTSPAPKRRRGDAGSVSRQEKVSPKVRPRASRRAAKSSRQVTYTPGSRIYSPVSVRKGVRSNSRMPRSTTPRNSRFSISWASPSVARLA